MLFIGGTLHTFVLDFGWHPFPESFAVLPMCCFQNVEYELM